jgi:hypothetical protein
VNGWRWHLWHFCDIARKRRRPPYVLSARTNEAAQRDGDGIGAVPLLGDASTCCGPRTDETCSISDVVFQEAASSLLKDRGGRRREGTVVPPHIALNPGSPATGAMRTTSSTIVPHRGQCRALASRLILDRSDTIGHLRQGSLSYMLSALPQPTCSLRFACKQRLGN